MTTVMATLHVHVHSGGDISFGTGHFHTFHEYVCDFKPNEIDLRLNKPDSDHISLRDITLVPSPFDECELEGYEARSNIPVVLFKFDDKVRLDGFIALGAAQSCKVGHRDKKTMAEVSQPQQEPACSISHITDEKVQHAEDAKKVVAEVYSLGEKSTTIEGGVPAKQLPKISHVTDEKLQHIEDAEEIVAAVYEKKSTN
jgi:hypothetical protein